jgi:two-component system cell cycle sensor histidine kinase/response regulator CckA
MATEEAFSKAFHANPAPMVISHPATGVFVDVNAQWATLVGYTRDEQVGRSSRELGLWVDWRVREQVVDELMRTGSVRDFPAQVRNRSGEVREVLWSAEMISHEGEEVMLSLLYDITDRLRAEAKLRASETRFRRLLQNSNDVVSVLDANGTRIFTAGPVERLLGYEPHEMTGISALDHVHPDDRAEAQTLIQTGLHLPGEVRRFEYRFRHKNGHWIALETIGTNLLHDPDVRGIVLNSRDITERNRLQDQLQHAMKMEAIGHLAGGVAHDFNNLLTAIGGNIDLARIAVARGKPIDDYLVEAGKTIKSAATLTRQLLSFSRGQIIEPKVVDLRTRVVETKSMLARLLGETIDLQLVVGDEANLVRIDPGQLEQILVNLAVNARDAMPKGGHLIIEVANLAADAHPGSRRTAGKCVLLRVSDNGHGMSREVKQRIFEPFFTTKPKGRGTGLGLATTFGIVSQAGGCIEVDSQEGQGTSFRIYFPMIEGQDEVRTDPGSKGALEGRETILLVEDDVSVRTMTVEMLEQMGYAVLQAGGGDEALVVLNQTQDSIDMLLTDIVMPGMSGRELAERLLAVRPTVKVLFTSGYTEDVIVQHGIFEHQFNFIAKPFTMQSLALKLREVLEACGRAGAAS